MNQFSSTYIDYLIRHPGHYIINLFCSFHVFEHKISKANSLIKGSTNFYSWSVYVPKNCSILNISRSGYGFISVT